MSGAHARTSLRSPRSRCDSASLPRRPGDARTWTPDTRDELPVATTSRDRGRRGHGSRIPVPRAARSEYPWSTQDRSADGADAIEQMLWQMSGPTSCVQVSGSRTRPSRPGSRPQHRLAARRGAPAPGRTGRSPPPTSIQPSPVAHLHLDGQRRIDRQTGQRRRHPVVLQLGQECAAGEGAQILHGRPCLTDEPVSRARRHSRPRRRARPSRQSAESVPRASRCCWAPSWRSR